MIRFCVQIYKSRGRHDGAGLRVCKRVKLFNGGKARGTDNFFPFGFRLRSHLRCFRHFRLLRITSRPWDLTDPCPRSSSSHTDVWNWTPVTIMFCSTVGLGFVKKKNLYKQHNMIIEFAEYIVPEDDGFNLTLSNAARPARTAG